jgi:hypothetical protein
VRPAPNPEAGWGGSAKPVLAFPISLINAILCIPHSLHLGYLSCQILCARIPEPDENRGYLFFGLKFFSGQGFCDEP